MVNRQSADSGAGAGADRRGGRRAVGGITGDLLVAQREARQISARAALARRQREAMDPPNPKLAGALIPALVAALQRNFCSCSGTTHFGLRPARHALNFAYRGWGRFF